MEPDDGLRRPRGHPLVISDRATVADFVSNQTTYETVVRHRMVLVFPEVDLSQKSVSECNVLKRTLESM